MCLTQNENKSVLVYSFTACYVLFVQEFYTALRLSIKHNKLRNFNPVYSSNAGICIISHISYSKYTILTVIYSFYMKSSQSIYKQYHNLHLKICLVQPLNHIIVWIVFLKGLIVSYSRTFNAKQIVAQ